MSPMLRIAAAAALVAGLASPARADRDGNGVISNQERLDLVRPRSVDDCRRRAARCEMGMTPALGGAGAATKVAAGGDGGAALDTGRLSADKILDLLGVEPGTEVRLEQFPPSPVRLGAKDIRFRVTSPRDGFLVLLSISDEGELVQLFPNAQSDAHAKNGRVQAGRPITVPDPSYGIRFDATSVTKGTVIALVTMDPLKLSRRFMTRSIQVIPQDVVNSEVLPELAASLAAPADHGSIQDKTKPVGRFVATLRYEIVGP